MIILMAGLPGSGKSTLACALAERTAGVVINKDSIRAALFAPRDVEYSTAQDDFCQKIILETAEYILTKTPERHVFLDGRPLSRSYQIEQIVKAAEALKQPWLILHCHCSDELARERIETQMLSGEHPAANRDYQLYLTIKDRFEPIIYPKISIDTGQSLDECVELGLQVIAMGIQSGK